jgi:hypothetical protein
MSAAFSAKPSNEIILRIHRILYAYLKSTVSRDSTVGTANGYWLDDRGVGVRVPVGSRIFNSPYRPDRLWVLPNLLSNGCRGLFPRG